VTSPFFMAWLPPMLTGLFCLCLCTSDPAWAQVTQPKVIPGSDPATVVWSWCQGYPWPEAWAWRMRVNGVAEPDGQLPGRQLGPVPVLIMRRRSGVVEVQVRALRGGEWSAWSPWSEPWRWGP
jgi:hypothetical protein